MLESCAFSGSYGHSHQAEVYLVEIPAQLVIRDSWMEAEVGNKSYKVVRFDPAIDMDGPYVTAPTVVGRSTPVFDIKTTNWGLLPEQTDLPEQLRPYQVGRVESEHAPTTGVWAAGAVVWNRAINSSTDAAGWICTTGGTPGEWRAMAL